MPFYVLVFLPFKYTLAYEFTCIHPQAIVPAARFYFFYRNSAKNTATNTGIEAKVAYRP
jgi:hypothetical protein